MADGCMKRFRGSSIVVIIIVFLSLFTDSLLLTLVDPILPDMVQKLSVNGTSDPSNININGRYGYLVAAKGAAQFVCNPAVGILVTKFGYRRPMFIGDLVLLASAAAFPYGRTYAELFIIRITQGISSSVTAVTGMGLLAATFVEDDKRGKVMGIAIGGLSLGIIVGPVYGSVLYQFVSNESPFLVTAAMIGVSLLLQCLTIQKDSDGKDHSMKSMFNLLMDPYILIVAGNIFLLNLDVSIILAFLPMRLIELQNPETWELGIVVLPTSIGYLIASFIFPRTTHCLPRWLCSIMGLVISATSLGLLAFNKTFIGMLVITTFLGLALGMVSTSMQPIFAKLVDLRHSGVYGNVYAVSDMAVCLSMTLGPLVGGPVLYAFGFQWLALGVAILNLGYSPITCLLRGVLDSKDDSSSSGMDSSVTDSLDKGSGDIIDDSETAPLIKPSRSRAHSVSSVRSGPTMDISSVPTPRYMDCLSGVEDFYSEPEQRPRIRRSTRRQMMRYSNLNYV